MSSPVNFEKSLAELEQIVKQLENGQSSLEDSLSAFEKGLGIVKELPICMTKQKNKIEVLVNEVQDDTLEQLLIQKIDCLRAPKEVRMPWCGRWSTVSVFVAI